MIMNFFGSDPYLIRQAVTEELMRHQDKTLSVSRLDMTRPEDAEELERQLKYPSFFQETRVVVATNAFANAQTAELVMGILESFDVVKEPTLILIVLGQPDGRASSAAKKLSDFLEKKGKRAKFEPLTGAARNKWLADFCAQRECKIETAAAIELSRRVQDTWAMAMELEKLCAHAENGTIKAEDVATLVPLPVEHNEFELTDALYAHDKRGAIASLWRRVAEGVSEQLLLGTLASGIRTLLIAKSMAAHGTTPAAIAKASGLHPFVAQKAVRGASGYQLETLMKAHARLAALDRSAKDGLSDAIDGMMAVLLEL
jgi:DNA polymerase III delta subunit